MSTKQLNADHAEKLGQLAQEIRASHNHCLASFRTSVGHARHTGDLLCQAKELVPHGGWRDWITRNCDFDLRMA
ncbi:MAG TPA: hypothetical protein VFA26_11970 [Gemmataceae bacterium]|nr:hypothetical protein [Gemmataceae bacterium]